MKFWEVLKAPFKAPNGIHDERLERMEEQLRRHEKARDETLTKLAVVVEKIKKEAEGNRESAA